MFRYGDIAMINETHKDYSRHDSIPIAVDPHSKATLEIAHKAANSNATVLITGETGVGKEVIARYVHDNSPFSQGPFVSVNCAALPENMIEAILFGYEKGAFTNAINNYVGKFEQAENGSLLLDEISEISIGLQAKLLRVLQEREIERLGGKKVINVNARIIAATNRDLRQQVASGHFRNDLYYRLNVVPIHCVPLRNRPLDIIPIAEYFINKHADVLGKASPILSNSAKDKLMRHVWPGNVREMENAIQRTLIMTENNIIEAHHIDLYEEVFELPAQNVISNDFDLLNSRLKANEAKVIMDVLKETEGCRGIAARKLNISPRTLRYKISKLKAIGLKVPQKI